MSKQTGIFRLRIKIGLLFAAMLFFIGCMTTGNTYYPENDEIGAYSMTQADGEIQIGEKSYRTVSGRLYVPEDRNDPSSRIIDLPYRIIHSENETGNPPILYLGGGPGSSNMDRIPYTWMLEQFSFVQLGYRGIDGNTVLETPEFVRALKRSRGNPISPENIQIAAAALTRDYRTLEADEINPNNYRMLEVIQDMADFQRLQDISKVNLMSFSYGTRLAYYYSIDYPENINRSLMVSVNPPGGFIWENRYIADDLAHYNTLWQQDPDAQAKSPDILKTMENVLFNLPNNWFLFELNRQKIEAMAFAALFHRAEGTPSAGQVFDAFAAAEEGDYSGLAVANLYYDLSVPDMNVWGEFFMKGGTADIDLERDYLGDLYDETRAINSPFSALIWGVGQYIDFQWDLLPDRFRRNTPTDTDTLMVSGNVDFSTPAARAAESHLPVMTNGQQIILKEFGHAGDVIGLQPEAFEHLVLSYFETGIANDSLFEYAPMNFESSTTFQDTGKLARNIIIGVPAAIVAGVGIWFLVRVLTP